ncbi:MAG: aldo/keto reductase [Anaerolineaceae bacterium]|nr:aldo/keto reductase [Anaerolineaceae bacterium]
MKKVRLGRTNLMVTRTAFGALPIQRASLDEAKLLLRKAFQAGINFFDTARAYSDSEEKIGCALGDLPRQEIIIATKTHAADRRGVLAHLATSLRNMKTDYVDILQLHNPKELPDPDHAESTYAGLVEARKKGLVRFIGTTNHRRSVALAALESDLYDTLQFPLSSISSDEDLALAAICKQKDVGLIAMKALSGGLLTNAASAFAFLRQYQNVVPIWGVQTESELDEFVALEADPPAMDEAMKAGIETDRMELAGDFCRGCGYCLPCPVEIPINMAARMSLLLRRAPYQEFLSDQWRRKMHRIDDCTECRQCTERCPYGLDIPTLLKKMLEDYDQFLAAHAG